MAVMISPESPPQRRPKPIAATCARQQNENTSDTKQNSQKTQLVGGSCGRRGGSGHIRSQAGSRGGYTTVLPMRRGQVWRPSAARQRQGAKSSFSAVLEILTLIHWTTECGSRGTIRATQSRSGARYGLVFNCAPEKTHLPSPPPRARGARRLKDPCAGGGGASTAAPHDGRRAPTRVRPGATGPEAGLCPRRSGPLSLHLAHPCEMCARGRRPSDERRLIGRRRVPKDLRSAGSEISWI